MMMMIIQTVIETGTGGDDLLLLLLLILKKQDVTVGKMLVVVRWVIGCNFRYPVIGSAADGALMLLVVRSVDGQIER